MSKPQSQKLYAMNSARPDDSMIFVRRTIKPMTVKNRKAVIATPNSVEERGDEAAVGYDLGIYVSVEKLFGLFNTHINHPPR